MHLFDQKGISVMIHKLHWAIFQYLMGKMCEATFVMVAAICNKMFGRLLKTEP